MDALELALRCSSLLLRTMGANKSAAVSAGTVGATAASSPAAAVITSGGVGNNNGNGNNRESITSAESSITSDGRVLNESDVENHFKSG